MSALPTPVVSAPSTPEAAPRRVLLSVQGAGVTYRSERGTHQALEAVQLDIYDGEFICLVGPSGCGKSTLLNVLGGFVMPTEGQALFSGEPIRGPDPRRIFVFQERGVFPWLTVEENIGFGLRKMPSPQRRERIAHYVELVGLKGFERAYPNELSGGMKQRVEVARALAVNPDVLFMDEAFGALDSITRMGLRQELLRVWAAERKTIVFVTHDVDEAVQLADRVVCLATRPGRVQSVIPVDVPRPRDISTPSYLAVRDRILEEIGLAHRF